MRKVNIERVTRIVRSVCSKVYIEPKEVKEIVRWASRHYKNLPEDVLLRRIDQAYEAVVNDRRKELEQKRKRLESELYERAEEFISEVKEPLGHCFPDIDGEVISTILVQAIKSEGQRGIEKEMKEMERTEQRLQILENKREHAYKILALYACHRSRKFRNKVRTFSGYNHLFELLGSSARYLDMMDNIVSLLRL